MDSLKVRALSAFKGLPAERGKETHVKRGQVFEVTAKRATDLKSAGLVEDASKGETPKTAEVADPKGAIK